MGRKSKKTGISVRHKKKKNQQQPSHQTSSNFVSDAGPGCYIARRDRSPAWLLDWEDIHPSEFDGDEVPDIAIDIDECTLSLCNIESTTKVAYITVFDTKVRGATGDELELGSTTDNNGSTRKCVTFIILCPPRVFAHLCYLDPSNGDITSVRIESDVQEWQRHPNPNDEHPMRVSFPLQGGPFLCTQGENGVLTHFFSGNLHAIDFRCPVGTPLLAVANGTVIEAKDSNTLTGISVTNLFEWNSIVIKVDEENYGSQCREPLFVEYVHIRKASVKIGDRVESGQVIGESGSVGFSPEPHLHFTAFRSAEPTAPTVRVRFSLPFKDNAGNTNFLPIAGSYYDQNGLVRPKDAL